MRYGLLSQLIFASIAVLTTNWALADSLPQASNTIIKQGPMNSSNTPSELQSAIQDLGAPATWCDAAARLARLNDAAALPALLAAYRSRAEANKVCLLEAIRSIVTLDVVRRGLAAAEPSSQALVLRLMALVPAEAYPPLLAPLLTSTDPELRQLARDALRVQQQTPVWDQVLVGLLQGQDRDAAAWASQQLKPYLAKRSPSVQEAMQGYAQHASAGGEQPAPASGEQPAPASNPPTASPPPAAVGPAPISEASRLLWWVAASALAVGAGLSWVLRRRM